MATKTEIIFVCDLCKSEKDVQTHKVTVDNHAVEIDACRKCWQGVLSSIAAVDRVGRVPKQKGKKKQKVFPFPGESWMFTPHALIRLGERKIGPDEVIKAIENPEITTPGDQPELEVRISAGIKAVVDPHDRTIITAAYRDEELDQPA